MNQVEILKTVMTGEDGNDYELKIKFIKDNHPHYVVTITRISIKEFKFFRIFNIKYKEHDEIYKVRMGKDIDINQIINFGYDVFNINIRNSRSSKVQK